MLLSKIRGENAAAHAGGEGPLPTRPSRGRSRLARAVDAVVREPLFHFLILGVLLWAAISHVQSENDERVIRIGPNQIRQITESYQAQYGRPAQPAEVDQLLKQYVDDEVAYREGMALDLGRGDEIVRRRVIQKYQFLQNDLSTPAKPSAETLRAWFAGHRQDYVDPPHVSFRHLYFSPDQGGDAQARTRALKALARLESGASPETVPGDDFPGPTVVSDQIPDSAQRLFGKSEFADAIFKAPVSRWQGPFRSGFGWHLIHVDNRRSSSAPDFDAVQERVLSDYLAEQQKRMNERAFASVRSRYTVEMDGKGR